MPLFHIKETFYRRPNDYAYRERFCTTCTEDVESGPFSGPGAGNQPIQVIKDTVGKLEVLRDYFSKCSYCDKDLYESILIFEPSDAE